MISGRMKWRITLMQPIKTPDGMGGSHSTWQEVATVWAEFRIPKAQELTAIGTVISDLVRQISIRHRKDVRRGWRVFNEGKTYLVQHTYDFDLETTVLVCQEVVM